MMLLSAGCEGDVLELGEGELANMHAAGNALTTAQVVALARVFSSINVSPMVAATHPQLPLEMAFLDASRELHRPVVAPAQTPAPGPPGAQAPSVTSSMAQEALARVRSGALRRLQPPRRLR